MSRHGKKTFWAIALNFFLLFTLISRDSDTTQRDTARTPILIQELNNCVH